MIEKIYLYHSNDIHSHFEQWPKMAAFLSEKKNIHEKNNASFLFFDIGDHIDRANLITEATGGKGNIEVMNKMGYDAVTIGNNEGITLSHDNLNSLYDEANFDVIVANLYDENGINPSWVKPYQLFALNNNINVGVIGVTVPYATFYEKLGWSVKDPFDILQDIINEVREKADVVILLSHLGINDDERIAYEFDGIDVIMGGHTHHLFRNGRVINNTLLCAAGKFGQHIGEVSIEIDTKLKTITKKSATTFKVDNYDENRYIKGVVDKIYQHSKQVLNEEIVTLDHDLSLSWFEESPALTLLAEGLKEWCDAEISMLNAGVLLQPLKKGQVTREDLHRICPHLINPCKVVLSGSELKEIIKQSLTDDMQMLEVRGFGFRGKIMGRMIFNGVAVKEVTLSDGLKHIMDITILGKPIDLKREYVVATLDMFTFGYLYPELTTAKDKEYFLPELIRDVFIWKLNKMDA